MRCFIEGDCMEKIIIRNERKEDYRIVEEITREAFWNLHAPGCNEHYLVHIVRDHDDFIPALDFVAEMDGKIVGNILYTKAKLVDEDGNIKVALTFGPISVLPEYQRKGVGKALIHHSFYKASELGYDSVVIFGNPGNYVSCGFKSCKKYNICINDNCYPTAMLVKELEPNVFDGRKWTYYESPVYQINESKAEEFDKTFPYKEKAYRPSQEEFFIYSHSTIG